MTDGFLSDGNGLREKMRGRENLGRMIALEILPAPIFSL